LFEITRSLPACLVNLLDDVNKNFETLVGLGFQDQLLNQLMLRSKNQWRDIYVAVAPQKPEN